MKKQLLFSFMILLFIGCSVSRTSDKKQNSKFSIDYSKELDSIGFKALLSNYNISSFDFKDITISITEYRENGTVSKKIDLKDNSTKKTDSSLINQQKDSVNKKIKIEVKEDLKEDISNKSGFSSEIDLSFIYKTVFWACISIFLILFLYIIYKKRFAVKK